MNNIYRQFQYQAAIQKMRHSILIKPESRERKREFRDVSRSHSRLGSLSQSQLSKSVGKSRLDRSYLNQRECSRIFNMQNEESRALNQSKLHHHNEAQSHNNLMCVCCYNKKEVQEKRNRRDRQKQTQQKEMMQIKQNITQQNLHTQQVYQGHVRQNLHQMNDYNKKLIQRHQQKRLDQENKKIQQQEEMKINQYEVLREKENKFKFCLEQQDQLKQKYQEQMQFKQQKQSRQRKYDQTHDNFVIDAIIPNKQVDRSAVQTIRAAYKDELLKQIQQKSIQKKKEIENYKGLSPHHQANSFDLVTFAEKRNQEAKRIASQLKQNTINDINQKKNQQKAVKQQKQNQRVNQERQRKQIISEQLVVKQREEEMRRQKIQNYLSDLRGQIQVNKKKRLEELQWINQKKNTEPLIRVKEVSERDKDSCQGCHKKYPKKLLSEFVGFEQ